MYNCYYYNYGVVNYKKNRKELHLICVDKIINVIIQNKIFRLLKCSLIEIRNNSEYTNMIRKYTNIHKKKKIAGKFFLEKPISDSCFVIRIGLSQEINVLFCNINIFTKYNYFR